MAESVNRQGAAAEVANARMSGLAGAFEYFRGSVESTLISAALPFTDAIAGIIRRAGDLITSFTNLSPSVQTAAILFGVAAAAVGPLAVTLGAVLTVAGSLLGPVALVAAAAAALGVAWITNFGGIRDLTLGAWNAVQPVLANLASWAQGVLPSALASLSAAFGSAWSAVQGAVSAAWATVQPLLSSLATSLQGALPGALAAVQSGFATAWAAAQGAVRGGRPCAVSAWVKGSGSGECFLTIRFWRDAAASQFVGKQNVSLEGTFPAWTLRRGTVTIPANAVRADLLLRCPAPTTADLWADDFVVRQLP